MKAFWGTLRMELRRAFVSLPFLGAALGTAFLLWLSIFNLLKTKSSVYTLLRSASGFGFTMAVLVLGVVPFGMSFCSDFKNQFLRPACIRSSPESYCAAKVIATALGGGCATALGYALFCIFLAVSRPLVTKTDIFNFKQGVQFAPLLLGRHYLLYVIVIILLEFACSALFANIALLISTFIPNLFVTLFSPVIAWYVMVNTLTYISRYLNVDLIFGGMLFRKSAGLSLLYALAFTIVLCAAMERLIVHNVRRCLQHA